MLVGSHSIVSRFYVHKRNWSNTVRMVSSSLVLLERGTHNLEIIIQEATLKTKTEEPARAIYLGRGPTHYSYLLFIQKGGNNIHVFASLSDVFITPICSRHTSQRCSQLLDPPVHGIELL